MLYTNNDNNNDSNNDNDHDNNDSNDDNDNNINENDNIYIYLFQAIEVIPIVINSKNLITPTATPGLSPWGCVFRERCTPKNRNASTVVQRASRRPSHRRSETSGAVNNWAIWAIKNTWWIDCYRGFNPTWFTGDYDNP